MMKFRLLWPLMVVACGRSPSSSGSVWQASTGAAAGTCSASLACDGGTTLDLTTCTCVAPFPSCNLAVECPIGEHLDLVACACAAGYTDGSSVDVTLADAGDSSVPQSDASSTTEFDGSNATMDGGASGSDSASDAGEAGLMDDAALDASDCQAAGGFCESASDCCSGNCIASTSTCA